MGREIQEWGGASEELEFWGGKGISDSKQREQCERRYGGKKMLQEHLWSKDSKHEV